MPRTVDSAGADGIESQSVGPLSGRNSVITDRGLRLHGVPNCNSSKGPSLTSREEEEAAPMYDALSVGPHFSTDLCRIEIILKTFFCSLTLSAQISRSTRQLIVALRPCSVRSVSCQSVGWL